MLEITLDFPAVNGVDVEDYIDSEEEIVVGDIVTYDDGILAVVLDVLGDSMYVFNENGCVEKVKTCDVTPTDEYTDLVDMMMLKLQHTEV